MHEVRAGSRPGSLCRTGVSDGPDQVGRRCRSVWPATLHQRRLGPDPSVPACSGFASCSYRHSCRTQPPARLSRQREITGITLSVAVTGTDTVVAEGLGNCTAPDRCGEFRVPAERRGVLWSRRGPAGLAALANGGSSPACALTRTARRMFTVFASSLPRSVSFDAASAHGHPGFAAQ